MRLNVPAAARGIPETRFRAKPRGADFAYMCGRRITTGNGGRERKRDRRVHARGGLCALTLFVLNFRCALGCASREKGEGDRTRVAEHARAATKKPVGI